MMEGGQEQSHGLDINIFAANSILVPAYTCAHYIIFTNCKNYTSSSRIEIHTAR